ncbi:DUF1028 domain-containing protein [Segetibacter sp. 3557_3]|uniref:DUF1028 domain-containing protein n=1 Tax=Segetibacter sp. 3557_3 TaxID=2547429 RepID=UPI001058A8E1|nr:DUF1028 domain-containing protein [Segetibacter sp. 3557_3]TDH27024.1 DUF1028 domain-containing protein [Segetibacter sp. 3557_3]
MKKMFSLVFTVIGMFAQGQVYKKSAPLAHTYSIVARDSVTGEMAIGVQSHWFSVGTAVPWAEAGVGAVATQSFVDKSYGPKGLALLKKGMTARQVLDSLLIADEGRDVRQVAIVDSKGNIAAHTGKKCIQYASHLVGDGFSVQSNMMLGNKVNDYMYAAFKQSAGKPIAERVLLAMEAAEKAGGDIRGKQAAALIVVKAETTSEPWNERTTDLRVDDHPLPLKELRRLYNVHLAYLHMNNGDLAVEKNNMQLAMDEYNAAMKMFPANLEMKYWTAVTLANNKQLGKAMPMFKTIFGADKNWKELTRRLPAVGLLTVPEHELAQILKL